MVKERKATVRVSVRMAMSEKREEKESVERVVMVGREDMS